MGAVCCEASEDWSGRRYIDPSAIEGPWEREAAPSPDPTAEQLGRARARIAALSGLDDGALAAQVRLIGDSGRRPLHHFSRHYELKHQNEIFNEATAIVIDDEKIRLLIPKDASAIDSDDSQA